MANSLTRRARSLLVIAALGCTALAVPTLAVPTLAAATPKPTTPATPTAPAAGPSITTVQKQLGQLAVTNSQLVERYDAARIRVITLGKAADAANRAAVAARASYNRANVLFTQVVQAQYETGGVTSSSAALLDSESGTNYLDRLDAMNLLSSHDAAVVTLVRRAHRVADSKSRTAASLLVTATSERDALGKKKSAVSAQITKYRNLLAKLNSAQQAAYLRAQNPALRDKKVKNFVVTATTAGARRAVKFALAQVGKPYVFGADGPGSYDCSGLTMKSWQAGGVNLPHSAAQQYGYGKHVSRDQLQPGDLIFFYQPIGHVTIYIGNGLMVSAPTEGENVSVVPLDAFNSDYTGATRLT